MGKSTHTALWHELFDTPYLNGDLNLLGLDKDHIIAYGIPWCGTSGIFTAEAYELGGIILLGRDLQTDYLEGMAGGLPLCKACFDGNYPMEIPDYTNAEFADIVKC